MRTITVKTMNGEGWIRYILEAKDFKVPKEFNEVEETVLKDLNEFSFKYNIDDYQYKEIRYNRFGLTFEERPINLKYNFKVLNRIEFSVFSYGGFDVREIINLIPKTLKEFDDIIDEFKYLPTNNKGTFNIEELKNYEQNRQIRVS